MSFREKTAWITLFAILLVSALYVVQVPRLFQPHPGLRVLHSLGACLVLFILIELVAFLVLRLRYPKDARTPKDEREQLIDLKALRNATYVYVIGSFIAIIVTIHVAYGGPGAVGVSVIMAFVISEVVNYASRIIYYRRGS
jgi:Na+/melibiose symporter-like transporter